jgi:hypothetical protein
MRREIELWAPWMQKNEAQALIDEINQMPMWQRKPKARTLGERLNVPYGERERLRLRTILPCDVSDDGMEMLRKRKRRQRDKLRRLNKGQQSRADYLAKHKTSKEQPWAALGISRRTWYRRRGTSPHQVNLNRSSHQPVPPQKRLVSKKEVAEQGQFSLKYPVNSKVTETGDVSDRCRQRVNDANLCHDRTDYKHKGARYSYMGVDVAS